MEERRQPQDLLDTFRRLLLGGRWLLLAAQVAETLLLLSSPPGNSSAALVLALVLLYSAVSLALVHLVPIRKVPVPLLLALDVGAVGAAAYCTGGSDSPFLGQCYLIIFAAALVYALAGGIGAALLSAMLTVLLAFQGPSPAWRDIGDKVPYFLLTGTFTGYLVTRVKTWFQRYQESMVVTRQRELQEQTQRRELDVARSIQSAALPAAPPGLPGLELAARSFVAREVGGDFLVFLPWKDRAGIALGDVSGKGVPAALISTSIGHLLPWLRPIEDPGRALRDLNDDLLARIPEDVFVSMVLADLDLKTGALDLWTAGHPPPLVWKAREGLVRQATLHNQLLGILPEFACDPEAWQVEPGDVLLLYTDGLVEVRNRAGEQFDLGRLSAVLAAGAGGTAAEIAEAILNAVRAWGDVSDDLTLLVCRRAPETVPISEGGE